MTAFRNARYLFACCLAALLLAAVPARAYDRVTVLVGTPTAASNEFVHELKNSLAGQDIRVTVAGTAESSPAAGNPPLIVAVGVQALQQAVNLGGRQPIVGVLIPQPAFEKIRSAPGAENVSAIFLDQPLPRQMRLLRKLLPMADSVGILLGPTSARSEGQLTKAAKEAGLKPVTARVDNEHELTPALKQLLENSDALLAVPDPLVHSRDTAQTVLLTSYRHQKPVIGFSQAYVSAGALAAVYSSPAHIARQAAEIVGSYPDQQLALPSPQPPRYFSAGINRQVARSLGIAAPDAEPLTQHLIEEERP